MDFREYDPEQDRDAVHRIWREVGWLDGQAGEQALDRFLAGARTLITDIHGAAECIVTAMTGDLRYLEEELPLSVITSVTTSRVARKQGLAARLTAQLIAQEAAGGAALSTLGMFEQGFYNRLGYGTGTYEHWVRFDPAALRVTKQARPPHRLSQKDFQAIHAALIKRRRGHGSCTIHPANFVEAELIGDSKGFGLGYYDGEDGALSHFVWCSGKGEHGPYRVGFLGYRNNEEFLELMALLKSLGDQVRVIRMREPQEIQLQDLLIQPFRRRAVTEKSEFATGNTAAAYWQIRICDLHACLAKTHLKEDGLRFNLHLTDPIKRYLSPDAPWRGIAGDYIITLGPESSACSGADDALPMLRASAGAFTRLWLGVRSATGLAATEQLRASPELLAALDRQLCLPAPHPGIDY